MSGEGAERWAVRIIATLAAAAAAGAGTHATGVAATDLLLAAGLGAAATGASSRAPSGAWFVAAALAALGSSGGWAVLAVVTVVLAEAAVLRPDQVAGRVVGAAVGAGVVLTLLHRPPGDLVGDLLTSMLALGVLVGSAWSRLSATTRARTRRASILAGAGAGLAVAGVVVALVLARGDLLRGISRAQDGLDAARDGESDDAAALLDKANDSFGAAHRDLSAWWAKPALLLPVVGQHTQALVVVSGAGADLADAAATSARTARVQDLKVTDGRLDLARVRSMAAPLRIVQDALSEADRRVSHAGSPWLVGPVADGVQTFQEAVDDAITESATASAAVDVLPDLLGGSGPRRYFVAFGTPAETRELGGFMGAYAILLADDGDLSLDTTGRVRDLNEAYRGRTLTDRAALPDHLLSLQPERFWQNITATPDFPTTAEVLRQMWPPTAADQIDGVLYMDPVTLAALLELTGPIMVPSYDEPLTADNAAPFLLRQQYIDFPEDDRHDFLVDAATTVFDELTTGDLPGPAAVADTLAPSVREGRLLASSFRPEEQALFERLHLDGGLPAVQGDFLSVRASNRGQSKIDALMQRSVAYDVTVDPLTSSVHATVTVTVRNDAPASGLPFVVIGNHVGQPSGTNSTTVAVYTPLELIDVTQDGRPIGRGAGTDFDRFRYTALLDVPAGQEATVVFELAGQVDLADGYQLDVVPQPLVNADHLEVTVRGSRGWRAFGDRHRVTVLREPQHVVVPLLRLR